MLNAKLCSSLKQLDCIAYFGIKICVVALLGRERLMSVRM